MASSKENQNRNSFEVSTPNSDSGQLCHDQGVTLAWKDLSVSLSQHQPSFINGNPWQGVTKPKHIKILNKVSGTTKPGTLLAIMGASGAGKTTLLNSLAQRLPKCAIVDGDITINGHDIWKGNMGHLASVVPQKDLFFETLTVQEHMTFTGSLKLGHRFSAEQTAQRIHNILRQTGLLTCANVRIGSPTMNKSISSGERKRLSFASAVIADPPLLFCDEPTSGLDYFMAQMVVHVLSDMTHRGKTILCSIHQPSSEVFSMFNEVMLLAEGRVAFMGSIKDARHFFDRMGFVCPKMYNPADFYIQTLAGISENKLHGDWNIIKICDQYKESLYSAHKELPSTLASSDRKGNLDSIKSCMTVIPRQKDIPWPKQFQLLMCREITQSLRNTKGTVTRIIQKAFVGLFLVLIYRKLKIGQTNTVRDVMGITFLLITENTYPSMYNALQIFHGELPVVLREHRNGLYGIGTYYLTKILNLTSFYVNFTNSQPENALSALPFPKGLIGRHFREYNSAYLQHNVQYQTATARVLIVTCSIESVLFVLLTYWFIGLNKNPESFLLTTAGVILLANTAAAFGCLFSATFKDVTLAIACSQPIDFVMMISAGLFMNIASLPWYFSWAQHLSWNRYAYEALSIAQWRGIEHLSCEANHEVPCLQDGDSVLSSYGFDSRNLRQCFTAMTALLTAFHIVGYLSLVQRTKQT